MGFFPCHFSRTVAVAAQIKGSPRFLREPTLSEAQSSQLCPKQESRGTEVQVLHLNCDFGMSLSTDM